MSYKRTTCIMILVAIYCVLVATDPRIDSLQTALVKAKNNKKIDILNDLATEFRYINKSKSKKYADDAISLSKQVNYQEGIVDAYNNFSRISTDRGHLDKSIEYSFKAIDIADKINYYDGLYSAYVNLFYYYINQGKFTLSEKYLTLCLNLIDNLDDKKKIGFIYGMEATLLHKQSKFKKAIPKFRHSIEYAKQISESDLILRGLNSLALNYYYLGQTDESIALIIEALEFAEMSENYILIASLYNDIGRIYISLNKNKEAEQYFVKALETHNNLDTPRFKLQIKVNLANLLSAESKINEANKIYNEVLEEIKENKNTMYYSVLLNSATIKYAMAQYGEAETNFLEVLDYFKQQNNKHIIAQVNYNLAGLYNSIKRRDLALSYAKKSFEIYKSLNLFPQTLNSILLTATIYRFDKDFENAYNQMIHYHSLKDSIDKNTTNKRVLSLEAKLETIKKNQEIEKLQAAQHINKLQLQKNRYFSAGLTVIIALLSMFIYFVLRHIKIKSRDYLTISDKNKEIRDQNEEISHINNQLMISEIKLKRNIATKDKLFSIIGHDLKNPIHSFISISDLLHLRKNSLSEYDIEKYSNIIRSTALNITDLLENLLNWARSNKDEIDFEPNFYLVINLINPIVNLYQASANEKQITIRTIIPDNAQFFADRNLTDTIIRNLLNNAIKFTPENGEIDIICDNSNEKMLTILVKDSGVGIPPEKIKNLFDIAHVKSTRGTNNEKGSGFGLVLCKDFAKKNNGTISVTSELGIGSTFTIQLPKATPE